MRLIITGTPGTGKTTLAKFLSKNLSLNYFNITNIIKESDLEKEFNQLLDTFEIDEDSLRDFLNHFFKDKDNFIVDGHLSHLINSNLVDLCIVLRTENSVLYKRLLARGYSSRKIRDNVESEIFNQCYEESKQNGHTIITIDTTFFNDEDFNLLLDFLRTIRKQQKK